MPVQGVRPSKPTGKQGPRGTSSARSRGNLMKRAKLFIKTDFGFQKSLVNFIQEQANAAEGCLSAFVCERQSPASRCTGVECSPINARFGSARSGVRDLWPTLAQNPYNRQPSSDRRQNTVSANEVRPALIVRVQHLTVLQGSKHASSAAASAGRAVVVARRLLDRPMPRLLHGFREGNTAVGGLPQISRS